MRNTARINMVGKKYGKLTITKELPERNKNGHIMYECKCDCGNVKNILGASIRDGKSKSCGCLHIGAMSKHGMWKTPEFKIWNSMLFRCSAKSKSTRYYQRGIRVCERWKDKSNGFLNFIEDMGFKPSQESSIDRIDVNGNYDPSNCRWADAKEQANNRTNNRSITYKNKTMNMSEWCEFLGIPISTFANRLLRGWSIEKTIETPIKKGGVFVKSEDLLKN